MTMTTAQTLPTVEVLPQHPDIIDVPQATPFDQQVHKLMLDSIDKIAEQWIEQLKNVRANTVAIEQLIIQAVAKAKGDINRMHELGQQVVLEAQRGEEVCCRLAAELDQILRAA